MEINKQKVIVLTTGGTIEKTYNEFDGSLKNRGSIIEDHILQYLRIYHTHIEVFAILSKDSLEMTSHDRKKIQEAIEKHAQKGFPIVVLHGTDTLELSAKYCWRNVPDIEVAVVFTGAMKPLGFIDSDAGQNFIEALTCAKLLSKGFYVSFHSGIFQVPHVKKDHKLGTFIKI